MFKDEVMNNMTTGNPAVQDRTTTKSAGNKGKVN